MIIYRYILTSIYYMIYNIHVHNIMYHNIVLHNYIYKSFFCCIILLWFYITVMSSQEQLWGLDIRWLDRGALELMTEIQLMNTICRPTFLTILWYTHEVGWVMVFSQIGHFNEYPTTSHYFGIPRHSVNDSIYDFDWVFPDIPVKIALWECC